MQKSAAGFVLALDLVVGCATPPEEAPPSRSDAQVVEAPVVRPAEPPAPEGRSTRCVVRIIDNEGRAVPTGRAFVRNPWNGFESWFRNGEFEINWGWGRDADTTLELYAFEDAAGRPSGAGALLLELPNPLPDTCEVRLPPERPIRGRVAFADGKPVAGVRITARRIVPKPPPRMSSHEKHPLHGAAQTDADGAFVIGGLGDIDYELEIAPSPDYVRPSVTSARGGTSGVGIVVSAGFRPRVVVLGPSGERVERATVSARTEAGGPAGDSFEACTGPDGAVTLPRFVLGIEYELEVSPPWNVGALPRTVRGWRPQPETIVRLSKKLSSAGTIVDDEGRPVPHAMYWRFPASDESDLRRPRFGFADEYGRFLVEDLDVDGCRIAAGDFPCSGTGPPARYWLYDPASVKALATTIPGGTTDARVVVSPAPPAPSVLLCR